MLQNYRQFDDGRPWGGEGEGRQTMAARTVHCFNEVERNGACVQITICRSRILVLEPNLTPASPSVNGFAPLHCPHPPPIPI